MTEHDDLLFKNSKFIGRTMWIIRIALLCAQFPIYLILNILFQDSEIHIAYYIIKVCSCLLAHFSHRLNGVRLK